MAYDPLEDPPEDDEGDFREHWEELQDTMVEMCGGIGEVEDILLELYSAGNPVVCKYVDANYERYKKHCEDSRYDF